ncbi:MAG: YqgE/AlgH family protein [Candidatus Schekmanbacteria bacterium]|nr:YqgE/AlgH family protein [Candidatus Schekmanbacteria bacterium]
MRKTAAPAVPLKSPPVRCRRDRGGRARRARLLLLVAALFVSGLRIAAGGAAVASASDPDAVESTSRIDVGRVLVATRQMQDPRFREAVILITHRDADGTAGVVLNRPGRHTVGMLLSREKALQNRSDPIYWGGPVDPTALIVLVDLGVAAAPARKILGGLHTIAELSALTDRLAGEPSPWFRMFLGFSGWSPGQLEAEIGQRDWGLLAVGEATIRNADTEALWRRLVDPALRLRAALTWEAPWWSALRR